VRSFKAFLMIGVLFLVVLVALYVVPDVCFEWKKDRCSLLEDEEFQESKC
jgi:hypothetical protein